MLRTATASLRLGRNRTEETTTMFNRIVSGRAFGRSLAFAGTMAGATLAGVSVSAAGECPAGKSKADVRVPVAHAGKARVQESEVDLGDLRDQPLPRGVLGGSRIQLVRRSVTVRAIVPKDSGKQKRTHLA
jgi:hypothetical protein